ncbi:hypothetical protein PFISCL1PPCAC_21930, partial [Pristionchus fissidentatus]
FTMRESPVEFVNGMPCWIGVSANNNMSNLGMYLFCHAESDSDLWSADIEFSLSILNADPEKNRTYTVKKIFTPKDFSDWGTHKFVPMATILDPKEGFIKNDQIVVEATIKEMIISGFQKPIEIDFSKPGFGSDDIVLRIEEETFHVSKNYLSMLSPVFATMFFQDFAEKNKSEIELKNIASKEFIELLYVIYPSYRPITFYSAPFILALADRFQLQYATNLAESYLVKSSKFTTAEKLLFTDQYKLQLLQTHCFASLKDLQSIADLQSGEEVNQLSLPLRSSLLTRVMEVARDSIPKPPLPTS